MAVTFKCGDIMEYFEQAVEHNIDMWRQAIHFPHLSQCVEFV